MIDSLLGFVVVVVVVVIDHDHDHDHAVVVIVVAAAAPLVEEEGGVLLILLLAGSVCFAPSLLALRKRSDPELVLPHSAPPIHLLLFHPLM